MTSPEAKVRPFEWLTSAESLIPAIILILDAMPNDDPKKVLHVGCGSSVLGEHLLENPSLNIDEVVNVDKDGAALNILKKRWKEREENVNGDTKRSMFLEADFCSRPIDYPDGYFDLVVDKGTLDCTQCDEQATASLLAEIYRLLKPQSGVYFIVSFNDIDLLRPLLGECPGINWEINHSIMARQVEDLNKETKNATEDGEKCTLEQHECEIGSMVYSPTWSSGSFEPNELYKRTVNIVQCHRRSGDDYGELGEVDMLAVSHHINKTNDQWYQSQNPMLTAKRKQDLHASFNVSKYLDLEDAFAVLFSEAERDVFTFDCFLEDWNAFLETRPGLPTDRISVDSAIAFLEEMQ